LKYLDVVNDFDQLDLEKIGKSFNFMLQSNMNSDAADLKNGELISIWMNFSLIMAIYTINLLKSLK
jgi:hypothetical protein